MGIINDKDFNSWRNDMNSNFAVTCLNYKKYVDKNGFEFVQHQEDITNKLERFPNTIVRITRQMCDCDEECTRTSLSDFVINPCSVIEIPSDYKEDDKYYTSNLIKKGW